LIDRDDFDLNSVIVYPLSKTTRNRGLQNAATAIEFGRAAGRRFLLLREMEALSDKQVIEPSDTKIGVISGDVVVERFAIQFSGSLVDQCGLFRIGIKRGLCDW